MTHVVVGIVVYLRPVLEPYDLWPGLPLGHADEDDLVSELVLVVEVGGLCDARPLGVAVVPLPVLGAEATVRGDPHLTEQVILIQRHPMSVFDSPPPHPHPPTPTPNRRACMPVPTWLYGVYRPISSSSPTRSL